MRSFPVRNLQKITNFYRNALEFYGFSLEFNLHLKFTLNYTNCLKNHHFHVSKQKYYILPIAYVQYTLTVKAAEL